MKTLKRITEDLIRNLEFLQTIGVEEIPFKGGSRQAKGDHFKEVLDREIAGCSRCPFGSDPVVRAYCGTGGVSARVVFVDGLPGIEQGEGRAFAGRAGGLLLDIISAMNLKKEEVYFTCAIKCLPGETFQSVLSVAMPCLSYLEEELKNISPLVIVTMGDIATGALLGGDATVRNSRGRFHRYMDTKVMPTYHPETLLKSPGLKGYTWMDMQKVMAELGTKPS